MKQEGLYQNKVTVSLASIHNCKMAYCGIAHILGILLINSYNFYTFNL